MVRTDGGTQFTSLEFNESAKEYSFSHRIPSPRFPQSNGEAEKAVDILSKSEDPNLGFLSHRCTPLESGLSPADLLFGRKLRNTLPMIPPQLRPTRDNDADVQGFSRKDLALKKEK
ncbi:hypothetical protein PR048_018219 [Dryococelus australis]|uniref:Integrase catalytic domain-containing protein n=1 Tax=Dryococelus australis TaxID=614101 RepID=A0ABQ9HBR3_9NEOP|nr:hypothetical protein PR048_018219 [Dryococelus australis]